MLSIRNLSAGYDKKAEAIKNISFDVEKGEFVAVIGSSGSGKSTLLKAVTGLVECSGGEIIFKGKNILTLSEKEIREYRSHIGFIFQDYNLIDNLSVIENVLLSRISKKSFLDIILDRYSEEEYNRALELIKRAGLEDKSFVKARDLSGGQKQRVAIIRSIMQDAQMILADEPISSLDRGSAKSIMDYFKELNKEGMTIIINLHDIETAKKYSDRIIAIKHGSIVFDRCKGELDERELEEIFD